MGAFDDFDSKSPKKAAQVAWQNIKEDTFQGIRPGCSEKKLAILETMSLRKFAMDHLRMRNELDERIKARNKFRK